MITFDVVKEKHGWAIRMGEHMTTAFRSRDLAIREARCLADAIRRHGALTKVNVESGASEFDGPAIAVNSNNKTRRYPLAY